MAGNIKGITIEIDGNTSKLDKAMKGVNKTSRDLNKELKDINKSLKFNPGNTELVEQKQRVLAESIQNTSEKLKTLKEAQEQANEALSKGDIGKDQYDALNREIIKTENQLKSMSGEMDKITNKWDKVGSKIDKTADKIGKAGNKMTLGMTAPIMGIAALSMKAFKEVDDGLDTVVSKTGATGEAMASLEQSFRKVAGGMPASFDEVGNAIGEINTQFGLMGESLEKASTKMIKFAQINDADVTESTIKSKEAIEKYGLETKDLDMVLDAITKTAQNTGVSVDKLFDIVVKGSPQIKQMGLDFAQGTELMGRLEQKGYDSQKALSYMTKAQSNWAKENVSLVDGLKNLQDKLESATTHEEKLAIAAEAFGTKGGAFMLEILENGALNADEFAKAMEEAGGAVEQTWQGMLDPVDLVNQALKNLELAGSDLGEALQGVLLPILEQVISGLQKFADWFNNLSDSTKKTIVKIGLFLAALGPILKIIEKLLKFGGLLITGLGVATETIGLLTGSLETAGATATMIAGVLGKLPAVFGAVKGGIGAVITALTGPAGLVALVVVAIAAIAYAVYKNWDSIKEYTSELMEKITPIISEGWKNIKDEISTNIYILV